MADELASVEEVAGSDATCDTFSSLEELLARLIPGSELAVSLSRVTARKIKA